MSEQAASASSSSTAPAKRAKSGKPSKKAILAAKRAKPRKPSASSKPRKPRDPNAPPKPKPVRPRHRSERKSFAVTVKDVAASDFVNAYAGFLKRSGKLEVPKWVDIVKTSASKELAPYDSDWFYIRTASIARKLYLRSGVGIGTFERIYGSSKRRGVRPSHFAKGSGSIARHAIHSLEKLKLIEPDRIRGGRKLTSAGRRELDRIAQRIYTRNKTHAKRLFK